jgi:hypothetical protein
MEERPNAEHSGPLAETLADPSEVLDASRVFARTTLVGIGPAVGHPGPFPCRVELPTRDGPQVATFHLHPWDEPVREMLRNLDLPAEPIIQAKTAEEATQSRLQNAAVAVVLLDRERAWENLRRHDGSEWEYQPPSAEEEGTRADLRMQLATDVGWLMISLKAFAWSLVLALTGELEGNSEASSATTTASDPQPQ